jgi:rhodanese-related sulfurtransferase
MNINNDTLLSEIKKKLFDFYFFLEKRYGQLEDHLSLKRFSESKKIPPPEYLYAEFMLQKKFSAIEQLEPKEVQKLLQDKNILILDAREEWEKHHGQIANSISCDENDLQKIPKDSSVLVYCHFGVHSFNIAAKLLEQGLAKVYVLKGGIDAWAKQMDPSISVYEEGWC